MKRFITYIFTLVLGLAGISAYSQNYADSLLTGSNAKKVIQFSGLVVGGDSLYGIPGVHIYVPKAGRGTITSAVGYFSMPVLVGDSVVIRTMGYKERNMIIPNRENYELSVIVELQEDTLLLPEVQIFPWPTEDLFKQAFLALKLPRTDLDNMHQNMNEQVLKRMMYTMDKDGSMNHHYYMQQQVIRQENRMMNDKAYLMNWVNPFAWANFINQVKRGEHKNKSKEYEYDYEED